MADISLRHVSKSYGTKQVLHDIELEIADGEFLVMLGPSGCGKSTLLRCIAGLEEIGGGEIAIGARRVDRLEPRERGCAMVFQNYALYPHMSVRRNIGYALKVAGMPRARREAEVARVAESVGLGEMLDRKPGQLSGGQRQRVAMARAIVRAPQVFLFDEPLSNLDARLRVEMRHEIRRIHDRVGATSVFVTHDQAEGMTLADRLMVMKDGRIEQVGTPTEVYDRPVSTYVASFLGAPAMRFLGGTFEAATGTVRLDSGVRLSAGAWSCRDGALVRVGLRPELLSLAAPGEGQLPARFDFAEELGGHRLYHLRHEDVPLVVNSPLRRQLRPDEAVSVRLEPGAVHLFDATSGARLPERRSAAAEAPAERVLQ